MRFITGLLVTGLLSSSVFKVGAVAPKSEVNDTIVDLRPLVYEQPFQRKADKITDAKWFQMTYVGVPLVIAGLSVKHGIFVNLEKILFRIFITVMMIICNMLRP